MDTPNVMLENDPGTRTRGGIPARWWATTQPWSVPSKTTTVGHALRLLTHERRRRNVQGRPEEPGITTKTHGFDPEQRPAGGRVAFDDIPAGASVAVSYPMTDPIAIGTPERLSRWRLRNSSERTGRIEEPRIFREWLRAFVPDYQRQ